MADVWTDRLSEYLDDELTPAARAALESHLAACPECAATLSELRAVVERARRLPGRPPAADLWPGIETRLAGPRLARSAGPARDVRPARRFAFTAPQLVAAGLALMVMSGGGTWVLLHGGRATSMPPVAASDPAREPARLVNAGVADQRYDEAIADLQQALESGRSQMDPTTIAVLEANLKAIDAAIEQSQRALAQDQENVYLNNHLADARQRKLALLRRATALAGGKT
ncbi:MAG TPA: zf-HC2 domain-containing protein [Vicinamibacterales bacterium]|nr:zf-HC2 domain-containing protein [Vicinamibacterales bacterium]